MKRSPKKRMKLTKKSFAKVMKTAMKAKARSSIVRSTGNAKGRMAFAKGISKNICRIPMKCMKAAVRSNAVRSSAPVISAPRGEAKGKAVSVRKVSQAVKTTSKVKPRLSMKSSGSKAALARCKFAKRHAKKRSLHQKHNVQRKVPPGSPKRHGKGPAPGDRTPAKKVRAQREGTPAKKGSTLRAGTPVKMVDSRRVKAKVKAKALADLARAKTSTLALAKAKTNALEALAKAKVSTRALTDERARKAGAADERARKAAAEAQRTRSSQMPKGGATESRRPAAIASRPATGTSSPEGVAALRIFLRDPVGVTSQPSAFQLRCRQTCKASKKTFKVVIVVGGKCSLCKFNQTIAECFDAGEGEFTHEPTKGATALGSRFIVSRPVNPGQCDKVLICSKRSAAHVGSKDLFADDRSFSVAQLFRGKSTRLALEQEPSEAAQQVVFSSPCLGNDVTITLDGIMLVDYDSRKLFDKTRRHSNGWKPLPRIVRSSFLSVAEIEAKNILMQGPREGPDYLLKIGTPWSAIHASSRRSQRKPLFRQDGRDYDLHDLCYVGGDEETDNDDDSSNESE